MVHFGFSTERNRSMSARQTCSSFVSLVLASALLVSGFAASAFAQEQASQASLSFTSQIGDTIGPGTGKTYTYSTPKNVFTGSDGILLSGVFPNLILMKVSGDGSKNSNPGVTFEFSS